MTEFPVPISRPNPQPPLEGHHVRLRPLTTGDAGDVQRLAGAKEIADTTLRLPHPYPDGLAESWIESTGVRYESGDGVVYAITTRDEGELVGVIGLDGIDKDFLRAEMGYWVGVPYWNRGYCTEAARLVLNFAFDTLGLHRVFAHHMTRNPASGRVMIKLGMRHEGTLREHFKKWDRFEDIEIYGILSRDPRN